MSVLLFSARKRPGRLPQSAPKDDPAWICAEVHKLGFACKRLPTMAEKLLAAHRIAAEVRDRRGMKVMKTYMATMAWTAE